jgi:hypothetical protein
VSIKESQLVTKISKVEKKITGIWFFGLAGAGKTFATQICGKLIDQAFVIDGDDVRKFISFDLGYSSSEREIQIKRVLGLAQITIKNGQVPLVSTVTMSKEVYQKCFHLGFKMAHIIRPLDQLKKVRDIYATDQNVVGVDILQKDFDIRKIYNNGDENFEGVIKAFVE